MPKLKDCKGREWRIEIANFGVVERLRKDGAIDLNALCVDTQSLVDFLYFGPPSAVIDAAWSLLVEDGGTREQFVDGIDRDTLESLRGLMLEAVFDFFHSTRAPAITARVREAIQRYDAANTGSKNSDGSSPESAA